MRALPFLRSACYSRQRPNAIIHGKSLGFSADSECALLMPASSDRTLLFGILALQMDFITREQLVAGMQAWVLAKEVSLAELRRAWLVSDGISTVCY